MAAAAATLYVLLPEGSVSSIPAFALVYVVAVALGIVSHAPGGIGAFEATIVAGLRPRTKSGCNRGTRRLSRNLHAHTIPCGDCRFRRIGSPSQASYSRWPDNSGRPDIRAVDSALSAGIAFLGGIVLLISAVVPDLHPHLRCSPDILPMPFLEMSHLGASLVGVALLIVARGLARRLWRAWLVALVLFSLGAIFALAKGLAWEEAVMLTLMAGTLILFRRFVLPQADGRAVHPDAGAGSRALVRLLSQFCGLASLPIVMSSTQTNFGGNSRGTRRHRGFFAPRFWF